jgi:hypothetical protein
MLIPNVNNLASKKYYIAPRPSPYFGQQLVFMRGIVWVHVGHVVLSGRAEFLHYFKQLLGG